MLRRIGSTAARRPRLVLGIWLAILVLGVAAGPALFGAVTTDTGGGNDRAESERADQHLAELRRHLPPQPGDGPELYAVVDGASIDDPAVRASVTAATTAIAAMPGVDHVYDVYRTADARLR